MIIWVSMCALGGGGTGHHSSGQTAQLALFPWGSSLPRLSTFFSETDLSPDRVIVVRLVPWEPPEPLGPPALLAPLAPPANRETEEKR